jgi:hypothetical protein
VASTTEKSAGQEFDTQAPPASVMPPRGLKQRLMAGISRNVLVLGLVSFFTDVSSEMIVPVRILFMVLVIHTPLPIAGLI